MSSPFPGMDPFLEARNLWRGLHLRLINGISDDLQPQLRPRYVAMVEERTERIAVPEWEIRHRYLAIRDVRNREVVTVIEVLSPWNKTLGHGWDDYRDKQEEVLLSDANLVEIDLLRGGRHTIAAPASRMGPSDYRVCIHRTERPRGFDVLRLSLRDPLPNIGIPLRSGEPDVVLHLQAVLTHCYDHGAYDLVIDYTEAPDPPLAPEDTSWAEALLRELGLREVTGDQ